MTLRYLGICRCGTQAYLLPNPFFFWRCIQNKLLTDENIITRVSFLPFVCSLCHNQGDSSQHIIFDYDNASYMWNWLSSIVNGFPKINSLDKCWHIINHDRSKSCRITIVVVIIQIVNDIWFAQNQARFKDFITS